MDGINEIVGKFLRGDITNLDFWIQTQRVVTNRVQQVGFAKPRTTVNEQRVIGLGWGFRDGKSGSVGKTIGATGDEVIEVVFGV